jgi:hypothetical protein
MTARDDARARLRRHQRCDETMNDVQSIGEESR